LQGGRGATRAGYQNKFATDSVTQKTTVKQYKAKFQLPNNLQNYRFAKFQLIIDELLFGILL